MSELIERLRDMAARIMHQPASDTMHDAAAHIATLTAQRDDLARQLEAAREGLAPVFVIVRSTGEYSDRQETVIGYAATETEAQAIVDKATKERSAPRPRYPSHALTHEYRNSEGDVFDCWATGRLASPPTGFRFTRRADADAIQAANEAARAQWEMDCIALGYVDPTNTDEEAVYSYQAACPLSATLARITKDRP